VLAGMLASPAAAATGPEVKFTPPKLEIPQGPLTVMPELRGYTIRQVLTLLNRSGLHCRFEGSGMAVSQEPAPGTAITPGTTCLIKFKSGA
jgi:beta-lactam-binding protein with PASTA domain